MLHWYGKTKLRQTKQIIEETIVHKLFTHKILFVSENTRNYFHKKTEIDSKKLVVLHNGIDLDTLLNTPSSKNYILNLEKNKKKIIGFVGRLITGKGISLLLEFAQNLADNDKYLFLVVGSGPKQDNIKQFISDYQVKNIYLTGEIHNMSSIYPLIDCLLFTSKDNFEGMPGVVLEACAFGLPILARKSKPVEEISRFYKRIYFIDQTMTPENNLEAALNLSPCDNNLFKKEFSIESMVENTKNLYNSLMQ
jgi:glycosyltransferase involved in cell wall biosynthesis